MTSIGYLGPRGTFTQEALEANYPSKFERLVPYGTVPEVLLAVQGGEVDAGIVPVENSVEGSVNVTIDTLTFETDLMITGEVVHPVCHALMARPGVAVEDVEGLISHPQATAQCRKWLADNLPGVPVTAANSTAEAALAASSSDGRHAAIAPGLAASLYGLEVLAEGIEDYPSNVTRFILVGREAPPRTGRDKTTMVCFIHENRPGSLLEILSVFASRGINLTKIESRPTKKVLGEYCFYIDIEGHRGDEPVARALETLGLVLRELKLLGSYPAAQALEDT